mmetsp:Transcript_26268/g.34522  ORF Transcript_26268/g.34522 Transcript_26268/m.34522 type:complete len:274 (-) Transcript_26268:464-1285(-)
MSTTEEKRKSLFATYILWFFTGGMGLHHFYLGRDVQAFVWWSTFGGFFGVGWLRDFWMIPYYVRIANSKTQESGTHSKRFTRKPQLSVVRCLGEVAVGYFYGLLFQYAVASKLASTLVISIIESIGVALGIFLVGNIGMESGSFIDPLIACFVGKISLIPVVGCTNWTLIVSIIGAIAFQPRRNFKQQVPKKASNESLIKRITFLGFAALCIFALWGSAGNNPLVKQANFRTNTRSFLTGRNLDGICSVSMFQEFCNGTRSHRTTKLFKTSGP